MGEMGGGGMRWTGIKGTRCQLMANAPLGSCSVHKSVSTLCSPYFVFHMMTVRLFLQSILSRNKETGLMEGKRIQKYGPPSEFIQKERIV